MKGFQNQPIRLPGLSLDLARDGELAEPKPGVCSGLILSGAFYPDSKIGVWRRRTYQYSIVKYLPFIFVLFVISFL